MRPKLNLENMNDLRVIREQCECVVIFTKESNFTDGSLEACKIHSDPARLNEREEIIVQARTKKENFFAQA